MDVLPEATCADVERLFVDLAMHDRLTGFRAVQRMCCQELLSDEHHQLKVNASMGCGKTQAMIASILTLQERSRRAREPLPLCCVVLKQVSVGETVVSACMRGLLHHDVYSDWSCQDDFTTWVRRTHEGEDRRFVCMDAKMAVEVLLNRKGWEVSRHQGRQPSSNAGTVAAETLLPEQHEVLMRRVFGFAPHSAKRRRVGVRGDEDVYHRDEEVYHRPTLKKLHELGPLPPGFSAATIVVSYQKLPDLLRKLGKASLDLLLLDESHNVANNTDSSTWKAGVSNLCERAKRVLMFSGTHISRNGSRKIDYLEVFRKNAHCLVWNRYQAEEAGEIVPRSVVMGDSLRVLKYLRRGEVRRGVWERVSDLFGNTPSLMSDVPFVIYSLAKAAALHGAYLARLEATSPCANVLLMAPKNDVGTAMERLVRHIFKDVALLREWLLPLIRVLTAQQEQDAEECLKAFSRSLRVCCPNYDKKRRRSFVESMADWEDGHCSVLIATQWPFEGADMPHLHAVALYPSGRYQDNVLDQAVSRPCRVARGKKVGYVLMMSQGRASPDEAAGLDAGPNARSDDGGDLLATEAGPDAGSGEGGDLLETEAGPDAGSGEGGDLLETEAGPGDGPDAGSDAGVGDGPDAGSDAGVGDELETEFLESADETNVDADECKGKSLSFLAAVSRASAGGHLTMCPLVAPENSEEHRRLCARLEVFRNCQNRRCPFWQELQPFCELPQGDFALLTLIEYPSARGSLVVLGLLAPREVRSSSESHLSIELVRVYEAAPDWDMVQKDVTPLLDGSRHGFTWRGDRLLWRTDNGPDPALLFREEWDRQGRTIPPLSLCSEQDLPEGSRTQVKVVRQDFFRKLAHFPALHRAFLLGGTTAVLTVEAKSHSDATLPFSTSERVKVRHLFLSMSFDLTRRSEVPSQHRSVLQRLRFSRKLGEAQALRYSSDVVLLALVPVDGDREHGIVECRPLHKDRIYSYAPPLTVGSVDAGLDLKLSDPADQLLRKWQLEEVGRDEFRILEQAGGRRWLAPPTGSPAFSRLSLSDEGSIFTLHAPSRGSRFELECGNYRTTSLILASGQEPIDLRIRHGRNSYCCSRVDDGVTHWFIFPLQWIQERLKEIQRLRETQRLREPEPPLLTVHKLDAPLPTATRSAGVRAVAKRRTARTRLR